MADAKTLNAQTRAADGKGAARAVRRLGRVPAVIYGAGRPATAISLDDKTATLLANAGGFRTTLFEIEIEGGGRERAIPRDVQREPVKDRLLHIDFFRVAAGAQLKVAVPVHVIGQEDAPGIKAGGSVNLVLHQVELLVPAESIPEAIEVDVSGLSIGDSIHLAALRLPAGATATTTDHEATVVTLAPPLAEEVSNLPDETVATEVEVINEKQADTTAS